MSGLLSGVRVIESSMLLNGAATGMMLADLGAEVIKVESPFLGDYLRLPETSHLHRQTARNKRSIALDLKVEAGRAAFYRLLATADVFLTNAVGNRNDSLGIGYAQLAGRKPDLVYCQNTGFGASGPYANLPAHGQMMDALAGAMPVELDDAGLTRPRRDHQRRTATLASAGEGTAAGAIYAAYHIAAALVRRSRTGQGCYIDVSSAEAVLASAWVAACGALNAPESNNWWRSETNMKNLARYQSYVAADGKFLLFCPEETRFWHIFCDLVGRADLKERQSGEDLRRILQEIFLTRRRDDWIALAATHRLPIGPVSCGIEEVRADPQISARSMLSADSRDAFVHVGQPARVSGCEPAPNSNGPNSPAPELGQHTDVILCELGFSAAEISALANAGVTRAVQTARAHMSAEIFAPTANS